MIFLKRMYDNWESRHKNKTNYIIHMFAFLVGFIIAPLLLIPKLWWWAVGCFIFGYILQFIGHAIEGNKSGEELLVRKLLGQKE